MFANIGDLTSNIISSEKNLPLSVNVKQKLDSSPLILSQTLELF